MKISKHTDIINKNNCIFLKDYDSIVAKYNICNKKLEFGKNWNYSRTTLKTICNFIMEFIENPIFEELNNKTNKKGFLEKLVNNKIIPIKNLELEEELYK